MPRQKFCQVVVTQCVRVAQGCTFVISRFVHWPVLVSPSHPCCHHPQTRLSTVRLAFSVPFFWSIRSLLRLRAMKWAGTVSTTTNMAAMEGVLYALATLKAIVRCDPNRSCLWFRNCIDEHHTGAAYSIWLITKDAKSFLFVELGPPIFGIRRVKGGWLLHGFSPHHFNMIFESKLRVEFYSQVFYVFFEF